MKVKQAKVVKLSILHSRIHGPLFRKCNYCNLNFIRCFYWLPVKDHSASSASWARWSLWQVSWGQRWKTQHDSKQWRFIDVTDVHGGSYAVRRLFYVMLKLARQERPGGYPEAVSEAEWTLLWVRLEWGWQWVKHVKRLKSRCTAVNTGDQVKQMGQWLPPSSIASMFSSRDYDVGLNAQHFWNHPTDPNCKRNGHDCTWCRLVLPVLR